VISSLAGEAGLRLQARNVSLGFRYYVENFTIPGQAGTSDQRTDQVSTLRLRIGAKFGR